MSKHYSTKHYGHNIGLSVVLRQPNADHSIVIFYMDTVQHLHSHLVVIN